VIIVLPLLFLLVAPLLLAMGKAAEPLDKYNHPPFDKKTTPPPAETIADLNRRAIGRICRQVER